jgi:beta-lactam-binding protein with PASTA domain
MYVDEAMLLLNGLGLNLEIRVGGGGAVGYFEPAPGTLLARGQTVYVHTDGDAGDRYVPTTSMPNIISPALTEVEARGALSAAGMYGAFNFYCDEGSAGTETGNGVAIGQSPEPGEVVRVDKEVEVAMQCAAGAAADPDTALE